MLDLDLTEEEQLIITINESLSDIQLKTNENKFKALLDIYLKEQLNEKLTKILNEKFEYKNQI
jgi:hypothetical protein